MLRWLRWHLAKRRLASRPIRYPSGHVRCFFQGHQARVEDFPPDARGYEKLAAFWNDYASWFVPGYGRFLASAGAYYGQPIQTVLDLGCGTGLLTRRLARRVESVVGLDASEAMLLEACSFTEANNVRYVRADFRDFSLGKTFDAVVCGSDSLNYLQTPAELADVFRCVWRHLRPGGLFVFDVLGDLGFLAVAGVKSVVQVGQEQFEIYFFYDPDSRVSEARTVFKDTIERHRRIPIEEGDIRRAAGDVGLNVADYFTAQHSYVRQFCVLRKTC